MNRSVSQPIRLTQNPKINWQKIKEKLWKDRYMYLMFLPLFLYFLVFAYTPMYGILMAFKDYDYSKGILLSPFTDHYGMKHFIRLFTNAEFQNAFKNTLIISFGRLAFEFPVPIILAILFNEIRNDRYKKTIQTVFTFPHFLSWIIIVGILFNLFSSEGIINQLRLLIGLERTTVLSNPQTFKGMIFLTSNWKEAGYGTIVYLAAIANINPELNEAARIDGANRFHIMRYITFPAMVSTVCVMLLITVASMMSVGFDQIFNMSNPAVQNSVDIIDTLVYRMQFVKGSDFGFTTAIGLFKSVLNLTFMLIANSIIKRTTGKGLY